MPRGDGDREELDRLNKELEQDWGVTVAMRTGITTGEVIAGDPSSEQTLVTGDAVNTAARLEQAASAGAVLIGDPPIAWFRMPWRWNRSSQSQPKVRPSQ